MAITETSSSAFDRALAARFENDTPVKRAEAAYYMTLVDREKAAIRRESDPKSAARQKVETLKEVGKFVQSPEGQQLLKMSQEQMDLFRQLVGVF